MVFTIEELVTIAYALECRYGINDELAEKIYKYLEDETKNNYRL